MYGFAILEKPYTQGPDAMKRALQECNLDEELTAKLTKLGGRNQLHLLRLLRRSNDERNFALAYLRHGDEAFSEIGQIAQEVKGVIGSEGLDTMMFWTFAPYVYKALMTKGLSSDRAIKKVLSWARGGVSLQTTLQKGRENEDYNTMHLRGLERYRSTIPQGWVLDANPTHISHKFTEQEALAIATLLLSDKESGK